MITRPIQKLPNILIYKFPEPPLIFGYTYRHSGKPVLYHMVDTKTGKFVGEMVGHIVTHDSSIKQDFYPIKEPYKSFYIAELKMNERFKGYGRKFIELAQNLSKKSGCNGRVHLVSSRYLDLQNPPHVFYRKCGFTSNSDFMNSYLDN